MSSPLVSEMPPLELDQLTDFGEFFTPVLPLLRSLYWLLDRVSFAPPEFWDRSFDAVADRYTGPEWDAFFAEEIASRGNVRLVRPGFLETYANYMVDDWCRILGLAEQPTDPQALLAAFGGGPIAVSLPHLRPRVEVAFFCIDGTRWEVFAHDPSLLSTVREHLRSREDLVVREIGLADSVA